MYTSYSQTQSEKLLVKPSKREPNGWEVITMYIWSGFELVKGNRIKARVLVVRNHDLKREIDGFLIYFLVFMR